MFDVGGGELMLIILAVLVLFGPKKIPEVAQMIGKGVRKFREAQDEFTQHIRDISTQVEAEVNSVSNEVSNVSYVATDSIAQVETEFNKITASQDEHQNTKQLETTNEIENTESTIDTSENIEMLNSDLTIVTIKPAEGSLSR